MRQNHRCTWTGLLQKLLLCIHKSHRTGFNGRWQCATRVGHLRWDSTWRSTNITVNANKVYRTFQIKSHHSPSTSNLQNTTEHEVSLLASTKTNKQTNKKKKLHLPVSWGSKSKKITAWSMSTTTRSRVKQSNQEQQTPSKTLYKHLYIKI